MTPDPTASPSPTPPDQITTYSPMVKCEECGQTCLITNSDIATYARQGWPRHCGLTMTFVPAPPIPNSSSSESVPQPTTKQEQQVSDINEKLMQAQIDNLNAQTQLIRAQARETEIRNEGTDGRKLKSNV